MFSPVNRSHENYEGKLFTLGPVGYPNINRLEEIDGAIYFSPVIAKAEELPGFTETSEPRQVMVGFAHNTVFSVADTVIDAVKQGKIRHFFLVGGCDGAKPDRNYYTEFVEQVPLSLIISWYEQKAIAVLLTLLHLGIQNIRLGPNLPAFITPNVLKFLSDTYHLQPITTPEKDLADCLG